MKAAVRTGSDVVPTLIEADCWDDAEWLGNVLRTTAVELPIPKPRKPK